MGALLILVFLFTPILIVSAIGTAAIFLLFAARSGVGVDPEELVLFRQLQQTLIDKLEHASASVVVENGRIVVQDFNRRKFHFYMNNHEQEIFPRFESLQHLLITTKLGADFCLRLTPLSVEIFH